MTKDYPSEMLRGALQRKAAPWLRAALLAVGTAVFFVFALHARYATLDNYGSWQMDQLLLMTAVMFTAVFALSYGVQLRFAKSQPLFVCLLLGAVTGAVVLAKVSLLDYVSDDYTIFLNDWISSYTQMGIREGLGSYIGSDYTPPYLYLMLVISRFPEYPWLYMVKLISMLFEVLMAYAMLRLTTLRAKGEGVPLLLYHMTMILPTVMFNGAYWGQCDTIYTGFCLLALYLALSDKPCRSMLCFGVALSFTLQTVFFLPALLPLWLQKKVKLRPLPLIPAMYMVMMLPALHPAGRAVQLPDRQRALPVPDLPDGADRRQCALCDVQPDGDGAGLCGACGLLPARLPAQGPPERREHVAVHRAHDRVRGVCAAQDA